MRFDPLFEPVSDDQPCGPDLEMDGDDAFLDYYYDALARLPERYVDTATGESFDRKSVDIKGETKAIAALLERSRDLRLLTLEAQFQILAGQLPEFTDCVTAVARFLEEKWDSVHPKVDGDPTDRRNTLELLDSRASVVMALENAPLFRDKRIDTVVWRDYAVGAGKRPSRGDGDGGDAAAIVTAMKSADNADAVGKAYEALAAIKAGLGKITDCCRNSGNDAFSPNFAAISETLDEMIALFAEARPDLTGPVATGSDEGGEAAEGEEGSGEAGTAARAASAAAPPAGMISSHAAAQVALNLAETYFARVEPSSPAFFLVRQARLLIGRPLVEALELLLPELAERAKIELGSDYGFVLTMNRMRALSEGLPEADTDDAEIPEMTANTREQAASLLSAVEAFYRSTEPSSPIPVLLFKAKTYLSRDFSAIISELFPVEQ